ncbi:MAG: peptidase U4 [Clostridium sp.]|nr:peptidase U4 [Clostridium sp.]
MEVYLDVVIIENLVIDLFLLLITFNILRYKVKFKRVALSSVIGAAYTVIMVFPKLKVLSSFLFQVFIAFIMILLAARKQKIFNIFKITVVFVLNSIIFSGICFYFSQIGNDYTFKKGITIDNFSAKYMILSLMIIYIIFNRTIEYFKDRSVVNNFIFDIEITIEGIKYYVKGFLDTGNELREPVTNLPCIIVEERLFKDFKTSKKDIFYINYSAIGYDGKLAGFKVDKVKIIKAGEKFRELDAIICPCKEVLSKDNEFNALLSRGVI